MRKQNSIDNTTWVFVFDCNCILYYLVYRKGNGLCKARNGDAGTLYLNQSNNYKQGRHTGQAAISNSWCQVVRTIEQVKLIIHNIRDWWSWIMHHSDKLVLAENGIAQTCITCHHNSPTALTRNFEVWLFQHSSIQQLGCALTVEQKHGKVLMTYVIWVIMIGFLQFLSYHEPGEDRFLRYRCLTKLTFRF
jgi:hypothetical protein